MTNHSSLQVRNPGKRQSRGKCHRIQFFQKDIVARKGAKSLRFFLLSFAVFATPWRGENLGSVPYYHHFNLLSARMTDPWLEIAKETIAS